MTSNLALEWVGFARDLVTVSVLATLLIYLLKLLRPTHESDRIAYLALAVATLGTLAGLVVGLFGAQAVIPWSLFCLSPLTLFWLIESEFDTRLFGLNLALVVLAGTLLLHAPYPLTSAWYLLLTVGGSLAAAGLSSLAASTGLLYLIVHASTIVTARKSARFFSLTDASIREIGYRLVAWMIPCQLFALAAGAMAYVDRLLTLWSLVDLGVGALLTAFYAIGCRRTGYETGYRPWLLLLMLAISLGALRLLSLS